MRAKEGGVSHIAQAIEEDLKSRGTGLHKSQVSALSDLAASVLVCRSVNTSEWRSILPRTECVEKSREQYISRFLSNSLVVPIQVMSGFVPEILSRTAKHGETVVIMLDQSKVADSFECLMVSVRIGERAIPVAWRVIETEGAIGFDIQKPLLDTVAAMIPEGVKIMLSADRFYGTANLIACCQQYSWSYRIRLKGNLILQHEGGEITTGEAAKAGMEALLDAELGHVTTHIGIIHEKEHPEPWIIAMNDVPSKYKTLDYGMRWGIEALFSDFKSRGFGITQTQLKQTDRIERLILILTIAIYWAVSVGMTPPANTASITPKKRKRSLVSFFKQGLRIFLNIALILAPIPDLWAYLNSVGC
jgi:hypothetical protein